MVVEKTQAVEKKEEPEVKVEVVQEKKAEISLTQEMLATCIFEIREFYKKGNKNLELAILDQQIKVNNSVVVLEVMGHVQEEIAQKMRPDLTGLIRELTGANSFSIQIEVKEEVVSSGPKLYTNSDKLNYLREKHPALIELQRKFGLDVDF